MLRFMALDLLFYALLMPNNPSGLPPPEKEPVKVVFRRAWRKQLTFAFERKEQWGTSLRPR